ncbi:RHS repeat-associated core domain-containing protein [Pseudomonas putida]|nr:RHS repeat-associated core domain-containing protein [Pseudomonas putida]
MNTKKKVARSHYYNNQLSCRVGSDVEQVFRAAHSPLAEHKNGSASLLAVDIKNSPITALSHATNESRGYTAYGYNSKFDTTSNLLGFNGEPLTPNQQAYLLGNGYRLYSPGLMRFYTADAFSPFLDGGLNAYAYCSCDPVNLVDPTGRAPLPPTIVKKITVISKNKVIMDQKHSSHTQQLKTATAEHARLTAKYNRVDATYGLNQKTLHGSKITHHEASKAKASEAKADILNQMVTQTKLIAEANSNIQSLEQRWEVNIKALQELSSVYGEVDIMQEFDYQVKNLRQAPKV